MTAWVHQHHQLATWDVIVCFHPRSWAHWARAARRCCRRCPTSICSFFAIKNRPVLITVLCFGCITCPRESFVRYFHFNHRTVTARAQMRIGLRIFESSEPHCGQSPWHPRTSPPQSYEASSPHMAAHRHPWAAGLVPDFSPVAALGSSQNQGDISTGKPNPCSAGYFFFKDPGAMLGPSL